LRVVTPVKTGLSEMRLRIYLKNNLIQSYNIFARIAPQESEIPENAADGWWAECEYTLSADFANIDDLEYRRVSVWLGKGYERFRAGLTGLTETTRMDITAEPDGRDSLQRATDATFAPVELVNPDELVGKNMGLVSGLNPAFLARSLARYRELLGNATMVGSGQAQKYGYRPDMMPRDPSIFDQSIKSLAELGQMLYYRIFGEQAGREIAERLYDIELSQPGPMVVQIARLNLDLIFPWDVLYDRPLFYHPQRNVVCREFMSNEQCRTACPHAQDRNVICPYGFWGYRYIIEQPLRPPNAYKSVHTRIRVQDKPKMAMVYGTGLQLTTPHRKQVTQIAGSRATIEHPDSVDGLLTALKAGDGQPSAVYFYCHGGNTTYSQWLVVNDNDPLLTIHLDDEVRQVWEAIKENGPSAPLVVLNGCHTGKYDPATLLSFVHQFARLGAAGVIGTEIPIHEYMGTAFGAFWVERFLKGEPVGQIVYDFRQQLLRKQNVLGLVYVPYCYANLHLETQES
jgi:hypothetical protein